MYYTTRNRSKRDVRMKLDLAKSRYDLLKRANDHVKEIPSIKFWYADINCHLKVKFNDENQKAFSSPLSMIFGILQTWKYILV